MAFISVLFVGCGIDASDEAGAEGSAGSLVERARVDAVDRTLVPITRLTVRSDGVMAVDQGQLFQVRFFDSDGEDIGSFGQQGQGPGEFMTVGPMGWRADSLWVFDPRQSRIVLISPDFTLARSVVIPSIAEYEYNGRIWHYTSVSPLRIHDDGSLFARIMLPRGTAPPEDFGPFMFAHLNPEGKVLETIAQIPDYECCFDQDGFVITYPFYERAMHDVAGDGSRIAVVSVGGERETRRVHATVLSHEGDSLFTTEFPVPTVPLERGVVEAAVDASAERVARSRPQLVEGFRDAATLAAPSVYPPLEDVVLGRDGALWIGIRGENGDRVYWVLDPAGGLVGTVRLERSSRIEEAEGDQVWVVERDDLDLESVVRYDVRWDG